MNRECIALAEAGAAICAGGNRDVVVSNGKHRTTATSASPAHCGCSIAPKTIFAVMSQLAADTDALNLSQGFPGFEPPEALVDRIDWHVRNGGNQYAPMAGVAALRQVIADKTLRFQRRALDTDREITVCTGATEGLFSAITAVVRPGDEVVILDPAYDAYEPAIRLAGGLTQRVPLQIDSNGHEFHPDWRRIADAGFQLC